MPFSTVPKPRYGNNGTGTTIIVALGRVIFMVQILHKGSLPFHFQAICTTGITPFLNLPRRHYRTSSRNRSIILIFVCRLLALQLVLLHGESHFQEILFFFLVQMFRASGNRRTRITASVHDMFSVVVLGLVEKSLNTGLGEAPSTSVERFLLGPDNGFGVRVHVEVLLQLLPREWVELLNAGESHVVNLVVGSVLM